MSTGHTTHAHAHDSESSERYINYLRQYDRIFAATHRQMINWLDIPQSSRVLDAGCGCGGVTQLMAEAIGAEGHITALDIEPAFLQATQALVPSEVERIAYREGSIDQLPFDDHQFDVVWCSRVVHHMPDQLATVHELRRVLKPNGKLALREDTSSMELLPFDIGLGTPGLDARLNAVRAWEFAQLHPSLPHAVAYPFGWTHLLREAGFERVTACSFVTEALPAFSEDLSQFVLRHWLRLLDHEETRSQLSDEDQRTLAQLIDPQSAHYLMKRDDLHFVSVSTVYVGYIDYAIAQ